MENRKIHMVDLYGQYLNIKEEIDEAISSIISSSQFIGGSAIKSFSENLAKYLNTKHIITCGNGTDALQIALMALDLEKGDEVIVPAFTYVATAEVIALLGLKPIMVDVHKDTFNINLQNANKLISKKTKAIIPVHLYGQSSNMELVMKFAKNYNLFVIEDNAQSIGATYHSDSKKTGTIGDIGTYSFFPSKNLGCYGDGGAISTNNSDLAKRIKMIASHGQSKKYYHEVIGVNSRLDNIQAAILNIKLKYLDEYIACRIKAANYYDKNLTDIDGIIKPYKAPGNKHVFHQYTIRVKNRNDLKQFLDLKGVPSTIYYPLPLYKQNAYKKYVPEDFRLEVSEYLCETVLSIPMHTELSEAQQSYIVNTIKSFYN